MTDRNQDGLDQLRLQQGLPPAMDAEDPVVMAVERWLSVAAASVSATRLKAIRKRYLKARGQ